MPVAIVTIDVKPDRVDDFIEATRANHEGSVEEPGNRRFDVLRSVEDPNRFVLYEWYAADEDIPAHRATPHYHAWSEAVADMLTKPRERVMYDGLFPRL